jgi:hypothetical protein
MEGYKGGCVTVIHLVLVIFNRSGKSENPRFYREMVFGRRGTY